MDDQDKGKPQENKTVEDYLIAKFFTNTEVLCAICQMIADNPELEEAVASFMSCPEVESIKSSLTNVFLTNFSDGHRLEQLNAVANGGDVDTFLMQNPGVLNILIDSPVVAELLKCMEIGLLKAMGMEPEESHSNKRLTDQCYNLALLIVEMPSFKEAMGNMDLD